MLRRFTSQTNSYKFESTIIARIAKVLGKIAAGTFNRSDFDPQSQKMPASCATAWQQNCYAN